MANFNFNKVILGGRLTANPELKQTNGGVAVVSFTVAVNRRFKGNNGEPQTDFIECTAWRQQAEFVCTYFSKGSSICVVGSVQTRSFTDKDGNKRYKTEVVADEVNFVDGKNDGGNTSTAPQANEPYSVNTGLSDGMPSAPQFETLEDGEELPF